MQLFQENMTEIIKVNYSMNDKDAIDYFLLEILANVKCEYRKDITIETTEDSYIIRRLCDIAEHLVKITKEHK